MIGVGDLRWVSTGVGAEQIALVPGTGWTVGEKKNGDLYAFEVSPSAFEHRTFADLIDLQCWLCTITSEGKP